MLKQLGHGHGHHAGYHGWPTIKNMCVTVVTAAVLLAMASASAPRRLLALALVLAAAQLSFFVSFVARAG